MIDSALVGINNSKLCPVGTGHFLTHDTARAFLKMSHAALLDGINIGIASSFRSFERQTYIWNRKFRGENTVLDNNGLPIPAWTDLSEESRILAILRWSALPGASRHHWGTDLDIYAPDLLPPGQKLQLTPEEYDQQTGYFSSLTTWLDENMGHFGFFRPYAIDKGGIAPEPWHLSFYSEAALYQQQFTFDTLYNTLVSNPIEGHANVLSLLPNIWSRFIININENTDI